MNEQKWMKNVEGKGRRRIENESEFSHLNNRKTPNNVTIQNKGYKRLLEELAIQQ